MKKIFSFLIVVSLLLCSGCRKMSNDEKSYSSNFSSGNVDYSYYEGNSAVEGIISDIESNLSEMQENGDVIVSSETSTVIVDGTSDTNENQNDVGKENAIVDGSIASDKAIFVEEANIKITRSKPLYYSYLTETQKQMYRFMKTAAENMTEGLFIVNPTVSTKQNKFSDITLAFRALSNDNPHIFWLPNSYIMSYDGTAVAFSYHENGYDIDYTISKSNQQSLQKKLSDVVSKLVNEANKLETNFDKELYFHDWLCQNVTYATQNTNSVYTAYGALVNGVAVCEGYSRAMQLLCENAKIPCTVVQGYSNGVGHMWNVVELDDGWYNLDITWDDDSEYGIIRYAYFNVSDRIIKKDHEIYDAVNQKKTYVGSDYFNIYVYNSNSIGFNYFEKNNLVLGDDMSHNVSLITEAVKNGKTTIELLYNNSNEDYDKVLKQLNEQLRDKGIHIKQYSPLGCSIALWLTFV